MKKIKISIKFPEDVSNPFIYLVDEEDNLLCMIDYDDQPHQVLFKVAEAICNKAGIEFDSKEM